MCWPTFPAFSLAACRPLGRTLLCHSSMPDSLILLLGLVLAVSSVVLADRVLVASEQAGRPARLLGGLWLPLLMCIPFLGLRPELNLDGSLGSVGVLAAVPLTMAIVLPLVLLSRLGGDGRQWHADDRLPMAWPAIGVMLMLLAVAGRGPEFLAVVTFAIGIVLLWIETIPRPGEAHGGSATAPLMLAFASAIGLSLVASESGNRWFMLVLCMVTAAIMLVSTAIRLGPRCATMSAGWACSLGPILLLGLVGQDDLRASIIGTSDGIPFVGYRQLAGLEVLVLPGLLILALSGFITGWARWSAIRGRLVAVLLAAGAAGLAIGLLMP
jgi:hypothetical protein